MILPFPIVSGIPLENHIAVTTLQQQLHTKEEKEKELTRLLTEVSNTQNTMLRQLDGKAGKLVMEVQQAQQKYRDMPQRYVAEFRTR